jgi:hypothetical protein
MARGVIAAALAGLALAVAGCSAPPRSGGGVAAGGTAPGAASIEVFGDARIGVGSGPIPGW